MEKQLTLPHFELLEEEKIDAKILPKDMQEEISAINMQVGRYNKKPSDDLFESITKMSSKLADRIQTEVVEKGAKSPEEIEAESAEEEKSHKAKEDADAAALLEKNNKDEEERKKKEADDEALRIANEEKEKKKLQPKKKGTHDADLEADVRAKIVNNEVSKADLCSIIGSDNLDSWNGVEKIGSLTLKKVHLAEKYRVA